MSDRGRRTIGPGSVLEADVPETPEDKFMSNNPAGATQATEIKSLNGTQLTVSLTVKDIARSLAWYRDVVGFTVEQEYEHDGAVRAVRLCAGAVRIVIGQDDGAKGWDRVKGEGFAFTITTDQPVGEVADRIKANGGTLVAEPTDMPWGARVVRVQDPDGFKFAISSPVAG